FKNLAAVSHSLIINCTPIQLRRGMPVNSSGLELLLLQPPILVDRPEPSERAFLLHVCCHLRIYFTDDRLKFWVEFLCVELARIYAVQPAVHGEVQNVSPSYLPVCQCVGSPSAHLINFWNVRVVRVNEPAVYANSR